MLTNIDELHSSKLKQSLQKFFLQVVKKIDSLNSKESKLIKSFEFKNSPISSYEYFSELEYKI